MQERKHPDEEMLIVHKPAAKPDPDKLVRDRSADRQELDRLRSRMMAAKDPGEKRELLAQIQERFGNEKAQQVVREAREQAPPDDDLRAPPGSGGGGKKGRP